MVKLIVGIILILVAVAFFACLKMASDEKGETMEKLKPCPFCVGKPECYRTVVDTTHGYSDAVAVRCLECNARTALILFDARKHPHGEEYEEAERLWNRGCVGRIEDGK